MSIGAYNIEPFIICAVIGYLVGSIPFGLLISKVTSRTKKPITGLDKIIPPFLENMGNILFSFVITLLTIILNGSKMIIAAFITAAFQISNCDFLVSCTTNWICELCSPLPLFTTTGLFAIIGHYYSILLKFNGEEGVATALGAMLFITPIVGRTACVIWLLTVIISRHPSLGILVSITITAPLTYLIYDDPTLTGLCAAITLLVWFKHRANIQRLVAGTEPKIGKGK